jgi:hypothetical protein
MVLNDCLLKNEVFITDGDPLGTGEQFVYCFVYFVAICAGTEEHLHVVLSDERLRRQI